MRHPHGSGLAWADGKRVKIRKGFQDFKTFMEQYDKVKKLPCIVHFRYMTEGREQASNCHPFQLGKSLAMAHNGTIRGIEGVTEDVSDTRAFVDNYIRPMVKVKSNWAYTKAGQRWMRSIIGDGNKLCFMNRHGTPVFVNGDLGHWSRECWYSNKSYQPRIVKPASGYQLLNQRVRKHRRKIPRASASEIIGRVTEPHFEEGEEDAFGQVQLPIGYGKQSTGKSLVDEAEAWLENNDPLLEDHWSQENGEGEEPSEEWLDKHDKD